MRTLLLDQNSWDLVVDANGNLAVADDPYAISQDVSSACRTFQGEVYYDTTLGVPYWAQILGKRPPLSLLKSVYVAEAETVPGVASAVCFISSVANRKVSGQIQSQLTKGGTAVSAISGPSSVTKMLPTILSTLLTSEDGAGLITEVGGPLTP